MKRTIRRNPITRTNDDKTYRSEPNCVAGFDRRLTGGEPPLADCVGAPEYHDAVGLSDDDNDMESTKITLH